MKFYAPGKLGKKQSLTPEGFLLCEEVPIARTGQMLYGEGEVPVEPGRDGLVRIERDEEAVFRPETIASYEGKPVTDDHPDEGVNPDNWKDYAVGVVQNVRRGTGIADDLLLADLLITDAKAIANVREGKREVSCGYDADYEQSEPGRGRQHNIIGNHVALVEQGRCGPRCAIGDQDMATKDAAPKRPSWKDRLRTAFKARDEKALEEVMDEAEGKEDEGGTEHHVHIHMPGAPDAPEAKDEKPEGEEVEAKDEAPDVNTRLDAIEALLKKLVPQEEAEGHEGLEGSGFDAEAEEEEEKKDDKKTGDSGLKASFQDTAARCELLSPGFKMPTFDAKADPKKSRDNLCACKRKALDAALKARPEVITPFLGGRTINKLPCNTVDTVFIGASELVRQTNNAKGARSSVSTQDFGRRSTVADLNKQNAAFWAARAGSK